ncbi:unnamed protein product [Merluccius merluccius]
MLQAAAAAWGLQAVIYPIQIISPLRQRRPGRGGPRRSRGRRTPAPPPPDASAAGRHRRRTPAQPGAAAAAAAVGETKVNTL